MPEYYKGISYACISARKECKPLRMTRFSNFAIRVLMYSGPRGSAPNAVPEIARLCGISYNPPKKAAVAELSRIGIRPFSGSVNVPQE